MIRTASIFLVFISAVLLGTQLQQSPGALIIAFNHWVVQTTPLAALVLLILIFFIMHVLFLLLKWIIHIPDSWRKWQIKRCVAKSQKKTHQGLIEFSEGYWKKAQNHLIKALPGSDSPLLNYLTAARAAQEMGNNQLRDDYLRQAQRSLPEAKIAVELTQAQLQLASHQWEQALATLSHLRTLAPHHPYVLKLLMHLYEEVRDWPQLTALLPELKRHRVISNDTYVRLQKSTYLRALTDLIRLDQTNAVQTLFNSLPKALGTDPNILALYGQFLLRTEQFKTVEELLRRTLRHSFNEELIDLYGKIPPGIAKLSFAENLLKDHLHSAALCLCLARLSQAKNLWGKAHTYFETSIELKPTPQAYNELGHLLLQLNDPDAACSKFREGLQLAIRKPLKKMAEQ